MIIEFRPHKKRKDLKLIDEVIYSMIKSSTDDGSGFKMKDDEIIELLKISKGTLHNSLNKLKSFGMIFTYSKEKGVRTMKSMGDNVEKTR